MLFRVSYGFWGRVLAIDNMDIHHGTFGRVVQIGDMPVNYSFWGRVTSIGDMDIHYGTFGRVVQIGDMPVNYSFWGRVTSIGDMDIHYGTFGRIVKVGRSRASALINDSLSHGQVAALVAILIQEQESNVGFTN
jgi:hypothetical protein